MDDFSLYSYDSMIKYVVSKEKNKIYINMFKNIGSYRCELLESTSSWLIHVPFTEKCLQTIYFAIFFSKFSLIQGSNGIGKSETVKEAAKLSGNSCFVHLCSSGASSSRTAIQVILFLR